MDKTKKPEKKKLDSRELLVVKEDLRKKLEANECYLFDNTTPSKVWKSFQLIKESGTGTNTGYVRCMKCKSIHKHDNTGTGTSHLKKHLDTCEMNKTASSVASDISKHGRDVPGSSVLTTFFKKATPINKKLKMQMLEGAMAFCAFDMRPFEALRGKGLEILIDAAIYVASSHGAVNAKDILPDPTTVSRNLKRVLKSTRSKLVPFFSSLMERRLCAATTDMWSDAFRKISYTTVTLHYTDSDWNIFNKVLFTCAYPYAKRKSAVNIREELCSKFTELGFKKDVIRDNVTFVTDQGPNIVKALQPPFNRMNCCAHMINTVLRNLFKPEILSKQLPKVQNTIVATKALVGFLKHSGISSQLNTAVHQEIETRWNSRLAMLKSVYVNFDDITSILKDRQLQAKLKGVNEKIIKLLIEFLEPFKAASDNLEGDSCTINLVLPEYVTLMNFCEASSSEPIEAVVAAASESESEESDDEDSQSSQPSDDDIASQSIHVSASPATYKTSNEIMSYLKQQARNLLSTKFIINDTHRVAILLSPIAKDIGLNEQSGYCTMTLEDRQRIIQDLRDKVALESDENDSTEQPASQPISEEESLFEDTPSTSTAPQPFKKARLSANERLRTFLKKSQVEVVQRREVINEVDTYFNSFTDKEDDTDVLQWWRINRNKYPLLSNYARKIFCIPASSASSERVFSAAGHVLQKRRSSLSPDSVDAIIFLNSNADQKTFSLDQLED